MVVLCDDSHLMKLRLDAVSTGEVNETQDLEDNYVDKIWNVFFGYDLRIKHNVKTYPPMAIMNLFDDKVKRNAICDLDKVPEWYLYFHPSTNVGPKQAVKETVR